MEAEIHVKVCDDRHTRSLSLLTTVINSARLNILPSVNDSEYINIIYMLGKHLKETTK